MPIQKNEYPKEVCRIVLVISHIYLFIINVDVSKLGETMWFLSSTTLQFNAENTSDWQTF